VNAVVGIAMDTLASPVIGSSPVVLHISVESDNAKPTIQRKAAMLDESNPWQTLKQETKFDCRYFRVRQDTVRHVNGKARPYNSIRVKYCGVAVVPLDAEGRVILVGQYRLVLDRYTWELPGGSAPLPTTPLQVATTELREETGARAQSWLKVVEGSAAPGSSDEVTPGYVAWDIEEGDAQPDAEELLTLRRAPFNDAVDMALNGEIGNMVGIAILLGLQARLTRGDLPTSLMTLLNRA